MARAPDGDPADAPRSERTDDGPPTFVTDDTHWWDGSQIYGRDAAFADALRSGEHGKLRIDEHGPSRRRISRPTSTSPASPGNFWVGLALLHSLFMREHNAICDHLHERIPTCPTTSCTTRPASSSRR